MHSFRNAFIADEGKKLCEFDLSQAEALVVIWLSNDTRMKEAFHSKKDFHSLNGAMIFDKTYEWVKENKKTNSEAKKIRQVGKTCNHAFNYKMGVTSLQNTLAKNELTYTLQECKALLSKTAKVKPLVSQWHKEIDNLLYTTRVLTTPLGMRRSFNGFITDAVKRSAYAFIPQSTVGHIINLGWINVYNKLGRDVDILLQVHDSLIIQYDASIQNELELLNEIKQCLLIPLEIKGDKLTIPVDCKTGFSWGSMKELDI